MTITDEIEHYLRQLEQEGIKSPNTIAAYRSDLYQLNHYIAGSSVRFLEAVDVRFLEGWLQNIRAAGGGEASVKRRITAMRGFFRYLVQQKKIKENPAIELTAKGTGDGAEPADDGSQREKDERDHTLAEKQGERKDRILSREEIRRILDAQPAQNSVQRRNKALLALFASSGIRTGEASGIRISDLDFLLNMVRVTDREGQTRETPFSEETAELLQRYLRRDRAQQADRSSLVFIGQRGSCLSRQYIWKAVRICGENAKLDVVLTPALLRKSVMENLLRQGADPEHVRQIMGIRSLQTVRRMQRVALQHRNAL